MGGVGVFLNKKWATLLPRQPVAILQHLPQNQPIACPSYASDHPVIVKVDIGEIVAPSNYVSNVQLSKLNEGADGAARAASVSMRCITG